MTKGYSLDFKWYLDIIKQQKTLPHAGYGIGNERVMQYIVGEQDIRNVSLFSLLDIKSDYWNTKKYGEATLISQPQKHILLSIGTNHNKELLLDSIKENFNSAGNIYYATEKTHNFLLKHDINTLKVFKISELGNNPNIVDLLSKKVFDLIINIPTSPTISKTNEFTDGKLIRKIAINNGISLVTDIGVANGSPDFYHPSKIFLFWARKIFSWVLRHFLE